MLGPVHPAVWEETRGVDAGSILNVAMKQEVA
jgi:hypothetical protein